MKILLIEICNYIDYPTGGHLSLARNMLKAFGNDLVLVGSSTDDTPVGTWTQRKIDDVRFDYFSVGNRAKSSKQPLIPARLRSFFSVRKYRRLILQHEYDFIFIQTPEVLFALPKRVLSRCILRMPGVENPLKLSRYRMIRFFQGWYDRIFFRVLRNVPAILATADEREIDWFVERSNGMISRENLIQYPTRYDSHTYYVRERAESKRKLEIPDSLIVVTTVGRLAQFKGWQLMLDAFEVFRRTHTNAVFYYIGDGEEQSKIEEYICKKKLSDTVRLIGRQLPFTISDYLNASDLFVMGSFKEGWATTLVEACACGVPCVVTDFSSSEMIVDGKNGYVVKSRNAELFARKMGDALQIPRQEVIVFNKKYADLSVQNMRRSLAVCFQQKVY